MNIKEMILTDLPSVLDILEIKYTKVGNTYTVKRNAIINDNVKALLNNTMSLKTSEIIIKRYNSPYTLITIKVINNHFIKIRINSLNFNLIYN